MSDDKTEKGRIESLEKEVAQLKDQLVQFQRKPYAPKPTEYLSIGDGCRVLEGSALYAYSGREISIGDHTTIYRGAEIFGPVTIGHKTFINRDAYIRSETTIGSNVNIGPFCKFITDSHEIGNGHKRAGKNIVEGIRVGDGTWIGASVTVLNGVEIGEQCIIAAGAVVTNNIPPHSLAGGVPAKVLRSLNGDSHKNTEH